MHNMNDTKYYLVTDAIRIPNAARICAENNIDYGKLYLGTPWYTQIKNSPLWIRIQKHDAVYQHWLTAQDWADSSVLFEFEAECLHDNNILSLQQNITITSDDERLLFFRFYSPKTLHRVATELDNVQTSALCGLAQRIQTSPLSRYGQGLSIINPTKTHTTQTLTISQVLAEALLS